MGRQEEQKRARIEEGRYTVNPWPTTTQPHSIHRLELNRPDTARLPATKQSKHTLRLETDGWIQCTHSTRASTYMYMRGGSRHKKKYVREREREARTASKSKQGNRGHTCAAGIDAVKNTLQPREYILHVARIDEEGLRSPVVASTDLLARRHPLWTITMDLLFWPLACA